MKWEFTFNGHTDTEAVKSVSWDMNSERIALGSLDSTVRIWDIKTGELLKTFNGHTHIVESVSWDTNSERIASGSLDKTVRIWDIKTGELLKTFNGHTDNVTSVSWDTNSERIASGSWDNTVRIWDANTGNVLRIIGTHSLSLLNANFANTIGLSEQNRRLIEQRGGTFEAKANKKKKSDCLIM